jgi:hypothetical protein
MEPQDRQRALAAGLGALVGGAVGGPLGLVGGASLAPLLEPLAAHLWAELTAAGQRRTGQNGGSSIGDEPRQAPEVCRLGRFRTRSPGLMQIMRMPDYPKLGQSPYSSPAINCLLLAARAASGNGRGAPPTDPLRQPNRAPAR